MGARRTTLRVKSQLALADDESATAADVYSRVRQAFPFAPLSARVGALAMLMDRIRRPAQ